MVLIQTTAGNAVTTPEPGVKNVPKKDLVSAMIRVVQERRFHVAKDCENKDLFKSELERFTLKVTASGNVQYEAGAGHDDTVCSVMLAIYWGESGTRESDCPDDLVSSGFRGDVFEHDFPANHSDWRSVDYEARARMRR
jgi:hypothetical protein